ncbi:hypothetical protein FALCPG4_007384 [Fusarium falciforme]
MVAISNGKMWNRHPVLLCPRNEAGAYAETTIGDIWTIHVLDLRPSSVKEFIPG